MAKLKFIDLLNKVNNGSRSLHESIPVKEVNQALLDWCKNSSAGILIGGCAVDFYVRPRMTMDVDFLFLSSSDIPKTVLGFKRIRTGAFQHNKTHVEIEVMSPDSINISKKLVDKVIKTAIINSGVNVASPSGLVALKLKRLKRHDIGDIIDLYNTGKVDLNGWDLTEEDIKNYEQILSKYN